MAQQHDSRIDPGKAPAGGTDSPRTQALDREQHYPNDPEERNAAQQRLNDTGTESEPAGVEADVAQADTAVRTGGSQERVRNTPPFGDWDETGPVRPDPEQRRDGR
ncbi:MAG: hypothetical protein JOY91_17915 [Sinobacteraceae bacterium]|nr:hypothetical protein [Nevskiaceae bacterium]